MNQLFRGALAMSGWVAGLFFFHFWRLSRDRLFLFLGIAFWMLAINWLTLGLVQWMPATRHYVFVPRLLAFVLIIVGIIDKNRRAGHS